MTVTHPVTIVAADHPSLDGAIDQFLDQLRHEPRFFGPSGSANPKPFPSLIEGLSHSGDGARGTCFRLAALDDGRVIGLARVDPGGHVLVAVSLERRGQGVGTVLARSVVERARALGFVRLCLRSSRRSRAATSLATSMGFMVIERGAGRLDLVLDLAPASHSA
jgi:GNAT superfamily N-acetyltransferase